MPKIPIFDNPEMDDLDFQTSMAYTLNYCLKETETIIKIINIKIYYGIPYFCFIHCLLIIYKNTISVKILTVWQNSLRRKDSFILSWGNPERMWEGLYQGLFVLIWGSSEKTWEGLRQGQEAPGITYMVTEAERNAAALPPSCFLLSPVLNDKCWGHISIQFNFSENIFMRLIKEGVFSKHSKSK